MDSFELNKILGALLGTCLVLLSLNITAGAIFAPHKPEKPGYDIAVPEAGEAGKAGPAEPEVPIATLLATSDATRGQQAAKPCLACHTFEKGGPNRVGPNLWGIVNRPKASAPGFNYSAALKGKGGEWTYDDLDHFLRSPKGMVPGTAMTFAGVTKPNQRADIINYLHTLADNPGPLPKAAEAAPAAAPAAAAAAAPAPAAPAAAPAAPAPAAPAAAPAPAQPAAPAEAPKQ